MKEKSSLADTETVSRRWAPVVYGRTFNADFWWRVVPSGTTQRGWLADAVHAVVGGGRGLADQPRFGFARDQTRVLVGVACRASELSDTMNSDGQRPLFCFVGWLSDGGATAPELPALMAHFRDWAGPVYQRWLEPDWQEHHTKLRTPKTSEPEPPPWPTPRRSADELRLEPAFDRIWLHPVAGQELVWQAAVRTPSPVCLTVGWARYRSALADIVTDVVAADVPKGTSVLRPTKPVETPPPTPASTPTTPAAETLQSENTDEYASGGMPDTLAELRELGEQLGRRVRRIGRFLTGGSECEPDLDPSTVDEQPQVQPPRRPPARPLLDGRQAVSPDSISDDAFNDAFGDFDKRPNS